MTDSIAYMEHLDERPKADAGGVSLLAQSIQQYARDLRRNSSGGDDYPWEIMRGVADYLDELLARSTPARCDGEPVAHPLSELPEYLDCLEHDLIGLDVDLKLNDIIQPGIWADRVRAALAAPVARCDAGSEARTAAIEECAKLCDGLRRKDYSAENADWTAGTLDCATAIRTLATPAVKPSAQDRQSAGQDHAVKIMRGGGL